VKLRFVLILAIFVLAGAASCPEKRVSRAACVNACTNLANLLAQDRAEANKGVSPGLDAATPEGQRNVDECTQSCFQNANERHLACLENAKTVDAWVQCDDGSKDWF
tara:strand:+ start:80 stop:400 length:321 start_codon:yes stop_codon:yes gene_type:complete